MLVKPEVVDRRLDRLVADAVHAVLGGTLVLDEVVLLELRELVSSRPLPDGGQVVAVVDALGQLLVPGVEFAGRDLSGAVDQRVERVVVEGERTEVRPADAVLRALERARRRRRRGRGGVRARELAGGD